MYFFTKNYLNYFKNGKYNLQRENHSFHLVDLSPYPILVSIFLFLIIISTILRLNSEFFLSKIILNISFSFFIYYFFSWFHDIVIESKYYHTFKVRHGLAYGMLLFIVSEIMFFFSFFWAFFYSSISPAIQIGSTWPPVGLEIITSGDLPLLNTFLLLTSGLTVTWAHKSITNIYKFSETSFAIFISIFIGSVFSFLQAEEYWTLPFSISDSIFGSTFIMATGFHGFHVNIGAFLLIICLYRHWLGHFTTTHHFGFIAATWYWHFVDVVWVFLYITMYHWSSYTANA